MAKTVKAKAEKTVVEPIPFPVEPTTVDVEAEVVTGPLEIMTADQKAEKEIQAYNLSKQWIATRKKKYLALTIAGIEDKEGYSKVETAWREIRNKRLAVAGKHKELKADYLVITRKIDGAKNEFTELLEEIEGPLKDRMNEIDNAKEEKKREAERALQAKTDARVQSLIDNGITFNGSYYTIGEVISLDIATVKDMKDDDFDGLMVRVRSENARILEAKAEQERKEQDEKDRLELQRQQQEEQERKLKERQDEMDRKEKEQKDREDAMLKTRTNLRAKTLEALGMSYNYSSFVWQFGTFDMGRITLPVGTVEGLGDDLWDKEYADIESKVKNMKEGQAIKDKERQDEEDRKEEQRKKEQKEADDLKARTLQRETMLTERFGMKRGNAGFFKAYAYPEIEMLTLTYEQVNGAPDEMWMKLIDDRTTAHIEKCAEENTIKKEKDAQAEKDRQGALSDADRLKEFLTRLQAANDTNPHITSDKVLPIAATLARGIDELIKCAIASLAAIK